jgi:hypothetical protein
MSASHDRMLPFNRCAAAARSRAAPPFGAPPRHSPGRTHPPLAQLQFPRFLRPSSTGVTRCRLSRVYRAPRRPVVMPAERWPRAAREQVSEPSEVNFPSSYQDYSEEDSRPCRLRNTIGSIWAADLKTMGLAALRHVRLSRPVCAPIHRLLTGWSLVRIRPGEPNKIKWLNLNSGAKNQRKIRWGQHSGQQRAYFAAPAEPAHALASPRRWGVERTGGLPTGAGENGPWARGLSTAGLRLISTRL